MVETKQYHPLLVAIHWFTALIVLMLLAVGKLYLKGLPNNEAKLVPLAIHMVSGIIILVLTLIRLVVRSVTRKPAPAATGNRFLDWVGRGTHVLLYLLLLGMGVSGLGIAQQAGLFDSVIKGAGELPVSFYAFPPRVGHGFVSTMLLAFILLHVAAALYHQFIRKDNLLMRMTFMRK